MRGRFVLVLALLFGGVVFADGLEGSVSAIISKALSSSDLAAGLELLEEAKVLIDEADVTVDDLEAGFCVADVDQAAGKIFAAIWKKDQGDVAAEFAGREDNRLLAVG